MSTDPQQSPPADLFDRLAALLVRRRWAVLITVLALTALAGWRVTKLELRTDFSELLPTKDPAVVVLHEMDRRMEGLSSVVVVIESPSRKANRRFVDEIVPKIEALKLPVIDSVAWGIKAEEAFIEHNKLLYPTLEDLERGYDKIQREITKRKNPLYVDLEEDDDTPTTQPTTQPTADGKSTKKPLVDSQEMEKRQKEILGKFPDRYYARADGKLYAVVVWLKSSLFGGSAGEEAADRIRAVAQSMGPTRYHPQMTFGLTGNVITSREERGALENDLVWATGLCLVLISLSIFVFYGRLSAVPFSSLPAVCAMILALGIAQLAFGYLNASTAFMGSIIVGNGINYAIIQMARYEEERRAGRAVPLAIAIALRSTWRATWIASVGAAVAYGSLIITRFRGFSQFGYIGGAGMILAWLVTMTLLPALWAIFDRRSAEQTVPRVKGFAFAAPIGRFVVRHPSLFLILAAALTAAAVYPIPRYAKDPFEYNFENLRNQRAREGEGEKLAGKLDPLFGRTLSPSFIVADRIDQVEQVRRSLRESDKRYKILGTVQTIFDFLPGSVEEQKRKLGVLARIRALIDKNKDAVDGKDRAELLKWRPPDDLRPLAPRDLPPNVKRYFLEKDGTIGRIVIYFAREDITVWDGHTQLNLASVVQNVKLAGGETVRSSGPAVIFAAMLSSITHDGPIVTLAAFLGVVLLVIIVLRKPSVIALVIGTLFLGVLWMVGGAAGWYVRINFLNFIALPITFGIGVDYAANLQTRYRLEGPGRVAETVAATGGAVVLCALTTIIGYGALLVADNYALRSFGIMAIFGEFACLTAAMLVLPAAMVALERRAARRAKA
jgi:uncharacterized protein